MQKHLHLLQVVEAEKTEARQLRQQIEDGEIEIERLKAEVTGGQGAEEAGGDGAAAGPETCNRPRSSSHLQTSS